MSSDERVQRQGDRTTSLRGLRFERSTFDDRTGYSCSLCIIEITRRVHTVNVFLLETTLIETPQKKRLGKYDIFVSYFTGIPTTRGVFKKYYCTGIFLKRFRRCFFSDQKKNKRNKSTENDRRHDRTRNRARTVLVRLVPPETGKTNKEISPMYI